MVDTICDEHLILQLIRYNELYMQLTYLLIDSCNRFC